MFIAKPGCARDENADNGADNSKLALAATPPSFYSTGLR
jgi:hypothetical protein